MLEEPSNPKEKPMNVDFHKYQIPADKHTFLCIDERPKVEKTQRAVRLPGAVYGLIDAIKSVGHLSEEDAWKYAKEHSIPMDAHTDNHHHEGNEGEGCGFGATVQNRPEVLGVVESVSANERLDRVKANGGRIFHYSGGHRPTHAILNYVPETTIDQELAWNDGFGPFVCDLWAVPELAHTLGLDSNKMMGFMTLLFKNTVNHLAPGTPFVELHK
jgi:hypothetical protein